MMRRLPISPPGLALAALTIMIAVVGVVLAVANRNPVDITAAAVVTFLAFPAMGLVILRFRPGHPIGYLLLAIGLSVYFSFGANDYARFSLIRHPGSLPLGHAIAWATAWDWIPMAFMVVVLLPMLFPDGRLLSRRWWIVVGTGVLFCLLAFAGNAFVPGPPDPTYPDVVNPLGVSGHERLFATLQNGAALVGLFGIIGMVSSVVVRYRRADGVQRHQLRWFLVAVVIALIPFIIHGLVPPVVAEGATAFTIPLIPVSIALAVLRYHLYDIDVVINRALVYGALAAFITGVYVAVVVGVGSLLGAANRTSVPLSIVATALVAVAFQPFRHRVQRFANRLVYGERATPYEVMAGFAKQMSETLALDDVLPRTAEVAARGVNASRARVGVILSGGARRAASWPMRFSDGELSVRLPVTYQAELVGEIEVEPRPGQPLRGSDQALLADLAAQVGVVLHNLRLVAELEEKVQLLLDQARDLQASRQRIVTARESERRRLEEAIRRGVQSELEAIASRLSEAGDAMDCDTESAVRLLDEIASLTQHALDQLRELAHGIFPPILADQGVIAALHAQLRKVKTNVTVDAAHGLDGRRFDPQIEAAVYFTFVEALRRATPSTTIRFTEDDNGLLFSIHGLTPDGDLRDSQDRIAAVGGSLEADHSDVHGRIPIEA